MLFQKGERTKPRSIKTAEGKTELNKPIVINLPLSQWLALRSESVRIGTPITIMCRKWMQKEIDKLVKKWEEK